MPMHSTRWPPASWRRFVPSPLKTAYWNARYHLDRFQPSQRFDDALKTVAPPVYRKRKERWEFEWQRDNWATLYRDPAIKEKALEYWNRHRFLSEIKAVVPFDDQTVVLDVGCGISTVLDFVAGVRYGVDPLADAYRKIYDYPNELRIQRGYGEVLPFPNDFFDVVFCSNCIDHTENPRRVVREVARVLKPGGHFVLTCEVFEESRGARNAGHPHSMSQDDVTTLVSSFEIIRRWSSPWYGLRLYALGQPPSAQREHILLLRRSA